MNYATPHNRTLQGHRHAVASCHYLASAAAYAILEAGGNAVDAGCAAGIALAVVHPHEVNFGGVAPIMIRMADGKLVTIAGLGHWPKRFPADLFMREYGGRLPLGYRRTVVPAAPDAWITALRDFGTMSFGDIAAASIRYAREGVAAYPHMVEQIGENEPTYRNLPSNAAIYVKDGRLPQLGDIVVQTDLANTLQYMADQEKAASGSGRKQGLEAARAAFYTGDIAERIVDFQKRHGGFLELDDMAEFRSAYEAPVQVRWRDFQINTCGSWCQGPVLAQAMRLLDKTGLSGLSHNSAEYIHLIIEILKCAFADREYHHGDPRCIDPMLDELLSDRHLDARLAQISRDIAMPEMPPPLLPLKYRPSLQYGRAEPEEKQKLQDTSYVCVVDRHGNAFSATPSDSFWGAAVVPGVGIVASCRGSQSRPDPDHPAGVGPGRRPRLTPNPAIALRDDGSVFPFGTPEGDMQCQAMLQVFLNIFHFGMTIQDAIEAPRFATWTFPNSFAPFRYTPGRVTLEDRFAPDILDALRAKGHKLEIWPDWTRKAGSVQAIYRDAQSGLLSAGADPREPSQAIVG